MVANVPHKMVGFMTSDTCLIIWIVEMLFFSMTLVRRDSHSMWRYFQFKSGVNWVPNSPCSLGVI